MIELDKIKRAYFIGIGGIGMSALARHFVKKGMGVFGYDKTPTALTLQLEAEGMKINFEDKVSDIPDAIDLVVYTPAVPKDHNQLNFFIEKKYLVKKRSEVLQDLTSNKFTIAVGGSHGKTSVTTMIAHVLKQTGYDCTAFLGGISVNYNSNYLHGENNVVVVEADEFDRSFLRLNPDVEVITAVDTDHLDIYGSKEKIEEAFIDFTQKIKVNGFLVAQKDVSIIPAVKGEKTFTYSFSDSSADYYVTKTSLQSGTFQFDISGPDGLTGVVLQIGGKHNVENALAAYVVARQLGIDKQKIKDAIASFQGVRRRFEYIIKTDDLVFIDDYAHHPEEIRAFLEAVRTIYPKKKITAVFQPHLYSRTSDLCDGFAASLDLADEVVLLNIYPAREKPIPGVTSELIFNKMKIQHKYLMAKENLLTWLQKRELKVLATIGAGDIDALVEPIKKLLIKRKNENWKANF